MNMNLSLTVAALAFTTTAAANHASTADHASNKTEHIIVSALRTEQSISASLAPVSVFTREEIETLQAKDLVELLARVPGAELVQSGSIGSAASLHLRGTNSSHTLFLIDGQRFNSATLGSTNFQFIDPDQIERIEIVRGPRSSIYGSDAIGGVVQIFTKKGTQDAKTYIRAGAGSHNARQLAAGSRGANNGLRYSVNAAYFYSGGFDSFADTTPPNQDDDGYRNSSIAFNLGRDFNGGGKLDLNYFFTKGKTEYDDRFLPPTTKPYSDNWIQTANLTYSTPITKLWHTNLVIGHSTDDSDNRDDLDSTNNSNFRTTRESFTWQNDLSFNDQHRLSLGFDYYDDSVKSTTGYTDAAGNAIGSRDNKAAFAVYQNSYGIADLELGLRRDDNEEFDAQTTANIALGFALNDNHKLIVSYGEGFKAPTFNDLYWPITPWSFGNPDLKPESSESYELQLRGDFQHANWSLNFYQTDIEDLIEWAPVDPNNPFGPWTPSNVENAEINGVELSASREIMGWLVNGSLQYLEAEDKGTGNTLINRPKKTAVIDLDKNFGRWQLGFGWQASSTRYGDKGNTASAAGYGVLNARFSYQVSDALKVQLKLNNILDKDYQNRVGYNQDASNGFVTLTYSL